MWAFQPQHPLTCQEALNATLYSDSDDVSGDHGGVSCDGLGCPVGGPDPTRIDRLEFNTAFGHYTYYKDRDHHIVDLKDKVVGHCTPIAVDNHSYHCKLGDRHCDMSTRFWCNSDIFP